MEKITPNDAKHIYNNLIEPDKILMSAMGNVLLAIFQGVQETARATVQAELQKAQQNQDRKDR